MSQIEIPKGWEIKKISDVVEKIANGSNEKQILEPVGIPITRIETISFSKVDLERVRYISKPSKELIEKYQLHKGDILFSHINSNYHIGKTALFELNTVVLHGVNLLLIRPDQNIILPKFLDYYFNFLRYSGFFISLSHKSVNQSSINQEKLKNITIPVPLLDLQKKIVQKLDYILEQFEEKKKIISESQKNNFQILENLSGNQKRVKRKAGILEIYKDNIVSKITDKKSLNNHVNNFIPLENFCIEIIDTPHSTVKYFDDGIPVIRTTDIEPEKINFSNTKFTSAEIYNERKKKIDPMIGDVLYTREAPWGISVTIDRIPFVVGQRILLLRPDKKQILPEFLSLVLNSKFGYEQAQKVVNKTTSEHVNIGDIKKFLIPSISLDEQEKILELILDKERKLVNLNEHLRNTLSLQAKIKNLFEHIPQSILKTAFSGKLVN